MAKKKKSKRGVMHPSKGKAKKKKKKKT